MSRLMISLQTRPNSKVLLREQHDSFVFSRLLLQATALQYHIVCSTQGCLERGINRISKKNITCPYTVIALQNGLHVLEHYVWFCCTTENFNAYHQNKVPPTFVMLVSAQRPMSLQNLPAKQDPGTPIRSAGASRIQSCQAIACKLDPELELYSIQTSW